MEVKIIDLDSAKIVSLLRSSAELATDFAEPLSLIGFDMMKVEEAVFSSQGRRGGGSWAQLKPSTIAKKGTVQILRTIGASPGYSAIGDDALYKSVTSFGAPGQLFRVTPHSLEFGTDLPEGELMQKGVPSRGIRARPFLKFTQGDRQRWNRILMRHLTKQFAGRGAE